MKDFTEKMEVIFKSIRDRSHLIRRQVIDKNGHRKTVWINPNDLQKQKKHTQNFNENQNINKDRKTPTDKELDTMYFNAIKKGDMETVQQLVDIKATSYASGTFTKEEADNPCYKLRRGKIPEHTIKVYKKASTVNGDFVTLFVGGSSPIRVPIGVWLDAVPGYKLTDKFNGRDYIPVKDKMVWDPIKQKYKTQKMGNHVVQLDEKQAKELQDMGYKVSFSKNGTNNKSGKIEPNHYYITCLANRPGWHLGEYPIMGQAGTKINGENVNNPNDVYYEVEIPDPRYSTYQEEANKNADKDIKYMPTDGSYRKITQVNKDSVTGDWFIAGCMKVIRPLTEKQVNEILDKNGIKHQGWSNGNGEIGELDLEKIHVDINATDKFRKLRDPITYDDNGNIIPLSKRFDNTSDDIRKSLIIKKSVAQKIMESQSKKKLTKQITDKLQNWEIKKSLPYNRDFDNFLACPIVDTETVPITIYRISENTNSSSKNVTKSLTYSGHKLQGRTKLYGMDISIENKKGSYRSGVDKDGHKWRTLMHYDYGYIRGTIGVDKDHVDVYIGPDKNAQKVYVIHQNDPVTHKYDEDKCMLCFSSAEEAKKAYMKQYDRPGFFGNMQTFNIEEFKEHIFNKKGTMIKKSQFFNTWEGWV